MEEGRKEINITIVTDDEKTDTGTTGKTKAAVTVTHDFSLTVMSTLLKNRLISGSFCGGRGDCGRCRIQFITGVTIPTALVKKRDDSRGTAAGISSCMLVQAERQLCHQTGVRRTEKNRHNFRNDRCATK